jgi:RHS repeat-associated protein
METPPRLKIFLLSCLLCLSSLPSAFSQGLNQESAILLEAGFQEQRNLNWKSALDKFGQAIASSPRSEIAQKAHIEIGKYYKYQRDWQEAIEEYHKAIAIAPHSRSAHDAKTAEAAIYYFRQDFPRALELFKEVLAQTQDWDQIKYCSYWIKELKRKMAFAPQDSFACGPESLKIALRILKIDTSDKDISGLFTYQEGNSVSVSDLAKVASQKGLNPRVVKVKQSDLQNLDTPFIALVEPEHYVVVTAAGDGSVQFIDPAQQAGTQDFTLEEFGRQFSGFALVFMDEKRFARANCATAVGDELEKLKGGICWCCPPSSLGGSGTNPNVEFDGSGPCSTGMPSWMVNTVNLNFLAQDIDFSYICRGMPVELIRTYNSDDPREGIFGRSWTFNYGASLVENSDKSIDLRRGDGRVDHFFWNGTRYQGPETVYDSLVKNADGTYALRIKQDKTTQNFNAQGRLISIIDKNGNALSFNYDTTGKLLNISDPNGKKIEFGYNPAGKVSSVTLPDRRVARFAYDADNNLIQTRDTKNALAAYEYDDASYITSITTPHQGKTDIAYISNSEGRAVKSITNALGGVRRYDVPDSHTKIRIRDSRNNATFYNNNSDGYTESITSPSGNKITFEYDSLSNRTKIKDSEGNATALTYDGRGNITSVTDPLGNKVTLAYDSDNNLISTLDPKGNATNFTYDAKSNLLEVRDQDNQVTGFAYNPYGLLKKLTDAKGGVTEFKYNPSGNLVKMFDPLGKITSYTYDALGRLKTLTDPMGNKFSYAYDGVDHLKKVTYPDAGTTNYIYNCCNLLQAQDKNGRLKFTYDALGRVKSFTNYDNQKVAYDYDSEGNLVTLTYPGNKKVNYEYDKDNRLSKLTDWLGNVTSYSYDGRGNLVSSASPGLLTIYKYDAAGRLTKLINYNSASMTITSGFEFTPDALGNRSNIKKFLPLDNPAFSRATTSYSYNSANQLISAGGRTFEYDDNGNLVKGLSPQGTVPESNYTYNYDNQLTRYTRGTIDLNYAYDALGNRIQKTSGSTVTKYIVDPNRSLPSVIAEADASGTVTAYYVYGLGLVSKIVGNNAYFYQYDGLGSTVAITDKTGAVKSKYAYDDFGNLAGNSTESVYSPFKYVGRFGVITDTKDLLYMRARYYSPSIGRFINKDPIGLAGGLNMYAYVGGNPINWIDPWGLRRWGPSWLERLLRPFTSYGNYGGPGNTDPTFQEMPIDSLDELFMEHDRGWANNQCSLADKNVLSGLGSLPINPYGWARKPKNIIWAIIYSMGATGYFFWFSQ